MTGSTGGEAKDPPAEKPQETALAAPSPTIQSPAPRRASRFGSVVAAVAISAAIVAVVGYLVLGRGTSTVSAPETLSVIRPAATAPLPPDRSVPAIVGWTDREGIAYRTNVDTARLRDFAIERQQRIDQGARRIGDAAAARVHAAVIPVFQEVSGRVTALGDWAFDWWTSWILLYEASKWTWQGLFDGPARTIPDRVQAKLVTSIEQQFDKLVIQSDATERKLAAALEGAFAETNRELAEECRTDRDALKAFLEKEAGSAERRSATGAWTPIPASDAVARLIASACSGEVRTQPSIVALEIPNLRDVRRVDDPVNAVILRMSRPFATKLISFVVLPAVVAAILGGFALPILGLLPNVISGIVAGALTGAIGAALIGFSASAAVDWALNRTDELHNRGGFEVQVRRSIVAIRDELEIKIIDAQLQAIRRQMDGFAAGPIAAMGQH